MASSNLLSDKIYLGDDLETELLESVDEVLRGKPCEVESMVAVSLSCQEFNLVTWLAAQKSFPRFYFQSRDGSLEVAGYGVTKDVSQNDPELFSLEIEGIDSILKNHPQRHLLNFFLASKFDPIEKSSTEWSQFPGLRIVLPEVMLVRQADRVQLVITTIAGVGEQIARVARRLAKEANKVRTADSLDSEMYSINFLPEIQELKDFPEQADWLEMCKGSIERFGRNGLSKIVLARKQSGVIQSSSHPLKILSKLKMENPGAYCFAMIPSSSSSFISVTPECLFRLTGDILESDALGGTAKRHEDKTSDEKFAEELYHDNKILSEHQLVVTDITEKFKNLTDEFTASSHPQVMKFSIVQHLLTRFTGKLQRGKSVADVLQAISPTSAVSGNPALKARDVIRETEPFARGLYAGPVGILCSDLTEIAVALRCMLTNGKQISFFAGAGILEQSVPEAEWEEISDKIQATAGIFPRAGAGNR